MTVVQPTGAWFSDSHLKEIQINATIANMKLQLFQTLNNGEKIEILTNEDNIKNEEQQPTNVQYIVLDGKISHEEDITLKLTLENNNKGKSAMYVKFKFELYTRGMDVDTLIATEINGFLVPTATTKGFVKDADGFYYYKETSAANAENALFERDEKASLMTSFRIPYSSFADENGNLILTNSDTIYIQLTVEAFEKI